MVEVDGVRLSCIRPPEDNNLCLLYLAIGTRTASRPECCRQTDDAWGMSGSIATVDVVREEDRAGELLRGEVHFVRGLRAGEDTHRIRPTSGEIAAESLGGHVERMLPRGRDEDAVLTHHRRGNARVRPGGLVAAAG